MNRVREFFRNVEPAFGYMLIRTVLYIAVGATGSWLNPDIAEQVLTAVALILGVDAATTAGTRNLVTSPKTAADLAAQALVGKVGEFIKEQTENIADSGRVGQALMAVLPVFAEYAQASLTADTKQQIQRRIHLRLRERGLLRKRNVGPTSLLALFAAGILLSGCTLIPDFFSSTVRQAAGDDARLYIVENGITFEAGEEVAHEVILDIAADQLLIEDPRCDVVSIEDLQVADCRLGSVATQTTIELTATGVTALANYERPGRERIYTTTLE